MILKEPTFTFGIEEEYHLVAVDTRDLAPAPAPLMRALEKKLGKQVSPEFLRSQVEIGTPPSQNYRETLNELLRLRGVVAAEARQHGLAPMAAATHPFGRPRDVGTTRRERYLGLERDLLGVARRLGVCGMHVHVGIEDDELRIDIMNQMRYFLPHLLMLSTSSPFWQGEDTGLKSYRIAVLDEMPRTGIPGYFASFGEYRRTVDVLVNGGVIADATKIWWDLRPSARFPTLEMRISDICPRAADGVSIAALYVSIARMLYRQRRANLSWRNYPLLLLNENRWRAQRYTTSEKLFDLGKGQLVAFPELMDELLELVAEDAQALGCEAEIARARDIARNGTSADRQSAELQRALEAGSDRDGALRSVVDLVVQETLEGT